MWNEEVFAREAVEGLAFGAWLRFGVVPADILELAPKRNQDCIETKGNPNHDSTNGQFTFGPGGARGRPGYRGMTAHGISKVEPVSGGTTDRNGRPVPEMFAPDPYALRTPAEALAHYIGGSGEDRNYYFNKLDTSQVKLSDFPEIDKLTSSGSPGNSPGRECCSPVQRRNIRKSRKLHGRGYSRWPCVTGQWNTGDREER